MGANRLRYFPFHVDDYLNDPAVMAMDADAEGCFIRLLARSWQTGTPGVIQERFVSEMAGLHRITDSIAPEVRGMEFALGEDGPGAWRRREVLEQIAGAFYTEDGVWTQKRMVAEYEKLVSSLEGRRAGAEKTNKIRGLNGYRDGQRAVTVAVSGRSPTEEVEVDLEKKEEESRTSCPEPERPVSELELPAQKGRSWTPDRKQIEHFRAAYPHVDLAAEFAKMRAWLLTNPMNQKTARGLPKFANGWLGRVVVKNKPVDTEWYD
jgi:uncharacterized protein YdaU (DUF1376 family)